MTVRMASRTSQRWLATAIALLAPLVAAPYFPGCAQSHGVYPTTCSPGGQGDCPSNGWDALSQTEQTLATAQTTSVVNIGNLASWNALEICYPTQGHAGTLVYSGADPANPQSTIYCYRDITWLSIWLRKFVAHQDANNSACTGGRVGIVNLAPIFSQENTLPMYLKDRHFNDTSTNGVLDRFKALWDAVLVELSDSAYKLAADDRASFYILIGNEIDMYLNDRDQPYPSVGASTPYADPVTRWDEYRSFYAAAADYVRTTANTAGVPVSVGTTARWGEQPGSDGVCGPAVLAAHYNESTDCTYNTFRNGSPATATVHPSEGIYVALEHLTMGSSSDLFAYTRYFPHFVGEPPSTNLNTLGQQFQTELTADFSGMGSWSAAATYFSLTAADLPIVIQEISYPSAWNDTTQTIAQNIAANANAEQQGMFAYLAFEAWKAHNATEGVAPILSLNWFNLHDFDIALCTGSTPALPAYPFCSWGLWKQDHQLKSQSESSGWFEFAIEGIVQNPTESDPPRGCP